MTTEEYIEQEKKELRNLIKRSQPTMNTILDGMTERNKETEHIETAWQYIQHFSTANQDGGDMHYITIARYAAGLHATIDLFKPHLVNRQLLTDLKGMISLARKLSGRKEVKIKRERF